MGRQGIFKLHINELFANLVAVLISEDVMMEKAMLSESMAEAERVKKKYYSFSRNYDLKSWNETNTHCFFAPTRAYIGKHLLRFPMKDHEKSKVLNIVYQASFKQIYRYWSKTKKLPSPSEANLNLIQELSVSL